MPVVEVPRGRVHYRVAGPERSTQPPVLFVHGLLVNSELWTKVAEDLAGRGIRSYAPDLPLGAHPIPLDAGADLSPRGVAEHLADLLAALDLTDVTLVGNDTGGALCQFLIDRHPERVGRLVLTNCDAFDQFPPPPFGLLVAAGRHERLLRPLMLPMKATPIRHSILGFGGLVRDRLDPALTRRWIEPVLVSPGVRHDAAKFMAAIDKSELVDVATRLRNFGKPVTLTWGDADRFFKFSFAERLAEAFGDARIDRVETGRTFLALDEPGRVADAIAAIGG